MPRRSPARAGRAPQAVAAGRTHAVAGRCVHDAAFAHDAARLPTARSARRSGPAADPRRRAHAGELHDGRADVSRRWPRIRASTFYFTASEEPARLRDIYREAPAVTLTRAVRRARRMRFDAYVASDFMWQPLPRGTCRIQVFHGVGGKYGFDAPTTSMRAWDRIFFVNERRLRNFVKAGAIDADSPAIRLVGMPKADALVNGTWTRDAIVLESLGLDPARRRCSTRRRGRPPRR